MSGIMTNAGIFVNTDKPKNVPESNINIIFLLPLGLLIKFGTNWTLMILGIQ